MSSAEVKCMLNDCAWREVNKYGQKSWQIGQSCVYTEGACRKGIKSNVFGSEEEEDGKSAQYSLRTLCYDPHLRFPAYFYLYCHDIPPIVVCVTICTVLHGTGCPSVPRTRCTQSPLSHWLMYTFKYYFLYRMGYILLRVHWYCLHFHCLSSASSFQFSRHRKLHSKLPTITSGQFIR